LNPDAKRYVGFFANKACPIIKLLAKPSYVKPFRAGQANGSGQVDLCDIARSEFRLRE
jgi:hypothetical protein